MGIYPFVFGIITFISTLSGGLVAIKYRNQFSATSALAGGVLIAISLFDLLPESLDLAATLQVAIRDLMFTVGGGFIFLLLLERYFSIHRVKEGEAFVNQRHHRGGWIGGGEISVHSFVEGLAIGLSFQFDFHLGILIAVAIIAHDFCDGISAVSLMLNTHNTRIASFRMLTLVAVAPILGVGSTLFFAVPERFLLFLISFLVGGFLYLGASDCLPEAYEKNPPWVTAVFSTAGFLLIFGVVRILKL